MPLGAARAVITTRKGPGWTPASFPSLTLWTSMRRSPGLPAVGSDITQWQDLSGAARHYDQHSTSAMPSHETRNGFSAAQFVAASSERLDNAAVLSTAFGAAGLMVVVAEMNGLPGLNDGTNYYGNNCVASDGWGYCGIFARNNSGTPQWACGIFDGGAKQHFLTAVTGQRQIIMLRRDGTNLLVSVDGGTESSTACGAPSNQTYPLNIGYEILRNLGPFNGWIYEVVYSTANGVAGDRASLIAYLKAEWNIA